MIVIIIYYNIIIICIYVYFHKRKRYFFYLLYLGDVTHPPAQHINRNLVSILVLPGCSLVPGSLNSGSAVSNHSWDHQDVKSFLRTLILLTRHDTADVVSELVHIGHGASIQKLVWDLLDGSTSCSLSSLHCDRGGPSLVDCLLKIVKFIPKIQI